MTGSLSSGILLCRVNFLGTAAFQRSIAALSRSSRYLGRLVTLELGVEEFECCTGFFF